MYAFACFIAPTKTAAWIMYNSDNKSDSQRKKGLYTFIMSGKPRVCELQVKFKKIKTFKNSR